MLESVLADVLTRVLGQYLEGIDRDSVRFGAWSGLVELRGVALRPEALAVLFETLGLHLPVTVEAGFIGLLRLQVPWNAIGTTPVQIHMDDITIIARPVRGDGSDDSELKSRERRINRAKLDTDDAVREASWGVNTSDSSSSSWSNWILSDQLRAKIVDNIQIHLSGISLRFEDPFSDPRRPYIASLVCESLKAVSANANWQEAFVERSSDAPYEKTRKLLEVKGFRIDWAPITPHDAPGLSSGTAHKAGGGAKRFETLELLKQFMASSDPQESTGDSAGNCVKSLLEPVDGALRLSLSAFGATPTPSPDDSNEDPAVDLDIRFPDVAIDLDDVQYACILRTSVYFARLATRGFRPKTPKARWAWAVDQLLPGFSSRRECVLRFTEKGILEARDRRVLYIAYRKSILKARRMAVEEPTKIAEDLERLEDSLSYEEVLALRDAVDRKIELEGEDWKPAGSSVASAKEGESPGTTLSSFWQMLGYREEQERKGPTEFEKRVDGPEPVGNRNADTVGMQESALPSHPLALRVAFLLRSATVRLSQNGYPKNSIPRVSLKLRELRAGVLFTSSRQLTAEAVLGSIEAWDMLYRTRMVYSRLGSVSRDEQGTLFSMPDSAYPQDVSEALDALRMGSNPARELLVDDDTASDSDDDTFLPVEHYFGTVEEQSEVDSHKESSQRKWPRNRMRGTSGSRDSSPTSTFHVTEAEFFGGTGSEPPEAQNYIAAFRYTRTIPSEAEPAMLARSKLEVSVATLEAIVDGPRGSFLWGLKFWRPKGMVQDPIMAFLGAAAGARIAELRMELEDALLAKRVPMQINAVIQAPRFVLRSSSSSTPAIVVNMGTLGICTSNNAPHDQSPRADKKRARIRYSNYVLTLDDLGMYFAPDLLTAVSQDLTEKTIDSPVEGFDLGVSRTGLLDTTLVERIIRPFSLRFMLQTLRDPNVVHVAHAPSGRREADGDGIAKVKVRGSIPGLYLVVTMKAMQHFLTEGRRWTSQFRHRAVGKTADTSADLGWQPVGDIGGDSDTRIRLLSAAGLSNPDEEQRRRASDSQAPAVMVASYDVKLLIRKVSVELRESMDARLVTAVASTMSASIVKTGKSKLQADFKLQSWAVTDGSRGSTAAFRRLVYAGTFDGSKGVSPPRSLSGTSEDFPRLSQQPQNFVSIQYTLDLLANEQVVQFQFLSLNMVCVRETYVKLASFFYRVFKKAKASDVALESPEESEELETGEESPESLVQSLTGSLEDSPALPSGKTLISAKFDGFNVQLIASGGAIALVEMKDSRFQFLRDENSCMRAWGDFRYFSIRDWTAPIAEHGSVVIYEKISTHSELDTEVQEVTDSAPESPRDQWVLLLPTSSTEQYQLRAHFTGINFCFLYRFSVVLQQYFSVLQDGVQPVVDVMWEQMGDAAFETSDDIIFQASKRSSRLSVDVELCDLHVRVPRHSACASEALLTDLSRVHIRNSFSSASEMVWKTDFEDMGFGVEYVLPSFENNDNTPVTATALFWKTSRACMSAQLGIPRGCRERDRSLTRAVLVNFEFPEPVLFELCEAQYTVLYFVVTENLAETINGSEVSADISAIERVEPQEGPDANILASQESTAEDAANLEAPEVGDLVLSQDNAHVSRRIVLDVDISIPLLSVELSRGWDVKQSRSKVIGCYIRNSKIDFTYSTPSHMLFEVTGQLLSIADLREERSTNETFASPLAAVSEDTASYRAENVTVTYEKETGNKAVIVVFLCGLHLRLVPELLRDLTCLAIPGWPFLTSSAFAPEFTYLGRSMTLVLSSSQILLPSELDEQDTRAIVFTGEFHVKLDYMKGTGAKRVSLQSTQVEVATVEHFPRPERIVRDANTRSYRTLKVQQMDTPLMYPADSFIEYVDPDVDECGCRLELSAEAILCLVSTAEIPLLRAVVSRPRRMRSSYLHERNWVQASVSTTNPNANSHPLNPKEVRVQKARENMTLTIRIPAARYLITDVRKGRFVPILEARLKSFDLSAHLGSMVQVQVELSMDLFNTEKGWWEPALEPWCLAASVSHGQSGTRAIVLKSEERLNVNVTPMSITAARTVTRALRTATTSSREQGSVISDTQKGERGKETFVKERTGGSAASRRPTVAAFLVRNELGFPVAMSMKRSSRRTTIAHNTEVEVGVQTEDLVSASGDGEGRSREEALKCVLSIPGFASQELSASEIGRHCVTFLPAKDPSSSRQELRDLDDPTWNPIRFIWEVQMTNGVPICTVRSLLRVINDTGTVLALRFAIDQKRPEAGAAAEHFDTSLDPGAKFSIPVDWAHRNIQLRPNASNLFHWSSFLPHTQWLYQNAREVRSQVPSEKTSLQSSSSSVLGKKSTVRCENCHGGSSDFFVSIAPERAPKSNSMPPLSPSWLDVRLRAPVTLRNSLPNPLSYRITLRSPPSRGNSQAALPAEGTVVAAGVISPQHLAHLHFSGDKLRNVFLSLAYENSPSEGISSSSSTSVKAAIANRAPSRFGPEISFESIEGRKVAVVLPSARRTIDSRGQTRRDFRATLTRVLKGQSQFEVFSGFWVRNRSDTALEVCSRGSYYSAGSQLFYLRNKPPSEEPGAYVCLEGPYLSIRVPAGNSSTSKDGNLDQSGWWTSPSVLEDNSKPMAIQVRGRSLEVEVRPATGLQSKTFIVTIRNSSWICNNTSSVMQWCQASALDAHGNCVMRLVNSLRPMETQGIHWDVKSAERTVHLRVADEWGHSDWIWSPGIPLDIGHSRELPAKMYRPKTHEQYIARVASKELAGSARALVIYSEDRHNPPYRIVNLCLLRAVAFSQAGSSERPWLVRAGKTTRYSWDNPLAPRSNRLLAIRILEPDDMAIQKRDGRSSSSDHGSTSHRHELANLNIDIVGDRVMVLSESYFPKVVVNITVDGATKIVTFCDEDENGKVLVGGVGRHEAATEEEGEPEDSVPTVGWDDIGHKPEHSALDPRDFRSADDVFDYRPREKKRRAVQRKKLKRKDTDAAVFLDSIGISIITTEPAELMYVSLKGVLINYEAYSNLECLAFHVRAFQVDNQLERTPYPVLMWTSTAQKLSPNDPANEDNAIVVEVQRNVTDDDIVMIKNFKGSIRPFNVCFEDVLISKTLGFLADTSIMGSPGRGEPLSGPDTDQECFDALLPVSKDTNISRPARQAGVPSSRRIYVHDFRINATSLRLTSKGSGAAVAKAAGINPSARALVAVVLNVENCEFLFPSLCVQNVFDSVHHFTVLMKEYYITQLSNQRMKLLASNSLMGNPAALFDAVGTGARDFFAEPGRAKGSADFIASVGRGSKSLFTHTVGGLVDSVSSIPRAVSSGIEKAVGDNEYLAERERIRGSHLPSSHRASSARNPAQGLATGAMSFAHGISSGVTGFIREPVQGARQGGAGGLLKGIGKAFIGGVAKPVAGAIDLVAEPAAGLSRQIAEGEKSGKGEAAGEFAVPERPPRAFRGRNQRLGIFDRRLSVGVCLYKAVQITSSVFYDEELEDWVELSDRPDRKDPNSELWIWDIVQKYSRSMPGVKKVIRTDPGSLSGNQYLPHSRPEKIRVALLTRAKLLVATLDCKLVSAIPLWSSCIYEVLSDGKEVLLRTTSKNVPDAESNSEMSELLSGAQSLIAAPWDVTPVGKRKRPSPGESILDRIPCGSMEARDDLVSRLRKITNTLQAANEQKLQAYRNSRDIGRGPSSVELAPISNWEDQSAQELKSTRGARREGGASQGYIPLAIPDRLTESHVDGRERRPSNSSQARSRGEQWGSRARALSSLEKRIRSLSSDTARDPAGSTDEKQVVIIANKMENGRTLVLAESFIENGTFKLAPPAKVEWFDAEVFGVECSTNVTGMVVFDINEAEGNGPRSGDGVDRPQVMLEFFDGGQSTVSFTTTASPGLRSDFERSRGGTRTVVFTVRQTEKGRSGALGESPRRASASGRAVEAGKRSRPSPSGESRKQDSGVSRAGPSAGASQGLSADELSLQQLVDIGFKFEDAVVALSEARGDLVKAVDILTTK